MEPLGGVMRVSERVHDLLDATPADTPVVWRMSANVLNNLLIEQGLTYEQRAAAMARPMRLYSINIYVEEYLPPNTLILQGETVVR